MRFKYGCPNQRGKDKMCTFKPVNGFDLDSFVIQQLCELSQEASKYYLEIMDRKLLGSIQSSNASRELAEARKTVEKLETDIAAQVRNMRDADDTIREFIQKDIAQLSDDLTKTRKLIIVLEEKVTSERNVSKELTETRKQLLSFSSLIEGCSYEEKLGIVASVVDRVILRTEGSARICHIFIKGCPDEYYDDFYDNYEPQDSDGSPPIADRNDLDLTDHPVEIVTNEMYNREQYGQADGHHACRTSGAGKRGTNYGNRCITGGHAGCCWRLY